MVWKARYTQETYQPGTTRIKRTFAFLPFKISGDMVWMAFYETLQLYTLKEFTAISQIDQKPKLYQVYEWINLSHRIITK